MARIYDNIETIFTPGFVWQMLKVSEDKYIYDAIKKGVNEPLPDYIEQGVNTSQPDLLGRRARWNEKTHEELALPTEIWRETIERRNRYFDVRSKIERGEINDFITYNLDIRSFVYDLLAATEDHLFVKHFYGALQKVTILDPTCGSGAFLFAAMNILEPLYEVCIDRMIEFNGKNDKLFTDELREIQNKYRSNIQHFVYKSIILRNLYGVDIMVESTEIAKLRLFLKMVAVVDVDRRADNLGLDPLPDIDFNIRCGNTLVGYATKDELMKDVTFGDIFARTAVHAFCIERSLNLLNKNGNISMIVPLALVCTQRMTVVQNLIEENKSTWYSNFAWRPAKLFGAVNRSLTIFVANSSFTNCHYTSSYIKWSSECRDVLFRNISCCSYNYKRSSFWMPKINDTLEIDILDKVLKSSMCLGNYTTKISNNHLYYRTTGGLYWKVFTNFAPKFSCNGKVGSSSRETHISINKKENTPSLVAFFSSNTFWWWYTVTSNLRDLNPSDLIGIHFLSDLIDSEYLQKLGTEYLSDLCINSVMLTREQKNIGTTQTQSFRINQSKHIIDEIDKALAPHYGFTEEELDFIINHDIKYRMGSELDTDNE